MGGNYPVGPFDRGAATYDRSVLSAVGFPHAGYQEVLDAVVRRADAQAAMNVLDLGVGTGNLAQRFTEIGCHLWGIDFSSNMLDKAREKLPTTVLTHADLLGDWPPELQRRFDRVVSTYVLHHFDLSTKLGLLTDVFQSFLVGEGVVVVGDISFPSRQARAQARVALGEAWEDDEYYWAADETEVAFAGAGLVTEYVQVSSYGGVYLIRQA